ncbi:hypothetical protein M404DRAFT_991393 [Pisolithus tinctorius Marx 270]|uniref:Uncharacterized protein n=1 Tax=Pisolithus tinctorius Marx 270 TaxID=870435 RepID=A0A0C3PZ56_PISTI|nr:hypothetical protein M404DRAFT_991393 [Pisolithus tinctorius Marx 270]
MPAQFKDLPILHRSLHKYLSPVPPYTHAPPPSPPPPPPPTPVIHCVIVSYLDHQASLISINHWSQTTFIKPFCRARRGLSWNPSAGTA